MHKQRQRVMPVDRDMAWTLEECLLTALLLPFLTHFHVAILEPVQDALFVVSSEDMTAVGQVVTACVWLVAGTLMLRRSRTLFAGVLKVPWIVWFVCFTFLSVLWSQDPGVTARKAVFLLLTTAFGIFFATRYSIEAQLRMICVAACIIAWLSICFALLLPHYGLDHDAHEGVWTGVFTQKNVCAREMLFLLACLLPYMPATCTMRRMRRLSIFAVLVVIAGTQSKTALIMTVMVLTFFAAVRLARRLSGGLALTVLGSAVVLGAAVCAWAVSAAPQYFLVLGRDSTMTGRTEIWRAVLEAIFKRPLLGYGFAAFWLSLRGESANIVLALRWAVPAAHNGFLEIWLQLGGVGLLLFGAGFLQAGVAAVRGYRELAFQEATWPLAVLLLTLVYNLDESSLMQPNDFLWVLYAATLVNLSFLAASHAKAAAAKFQFPLAA